MLSWWTLISKTRKEGRDTVPSHPLSYQAVEMTRRGFETNPGLQSMDLAAEGWVFRYMLPSCVLDEAETTKNAWKKSYGTCCGLICLLEGLKVASQGGRSQRFKNSNPESSLIGTPWQVQLQDPISPQRTKESRCSSHFPVSWTQCVHMAYTWSVMFGVSSELSNPLGWWAGKGPWMR